MARRRNKKKKHPVFRVFVKLQIVLILLLCAGLGYYFLGGYATKVSTLRSEAREIVSNSSLNDFMPSQTVSVYDSNNNLISQKRGEKTANYVPYEDIPGMYITAIISIEDKKFYKHKGVDVKGLARAVKAMVKNGEVTQGGSTITMQLAKLTYMTDSSRDWQYKIKQMAIASELEQVYSKKQIMEFYLNNIYFANGYYGVAAACKGYFDCELRDLDLSQICFLLAIPNSPTYYDPVTNYDNTIYRRNLILQSLMDDGKITEKEYKNAVREKIVLNRAEKSSGIWNNYVDTYTYQCATEALMEANGFEFQYYFADDLEKKEYAKKYDEAFSVYQKQLFTQGYSIYTSIDMDKQNALQESIDTQLEGFTETNEEGVYQLQSAGVCIDNESGQVVAIVGGRSQDFSVYTLNRAYQSHRQPGSAIKPLIVYTPCFERGYTKADKVNDYKFEGGPKNASKTYHGEVSIEFAVSRSLNTVAWQLYEALTPEVGLQYLKNMNFTQIVDEDYVLPTGLGGFTKGVSPLEMAAAYETLANDGIYRKPSCVKMIIDSDKNIVYSYQPLEQVVYKETAARMMTEVLQTVFDGTAKGMSISNGMPAAVKTGTTNDLKDGWFCGYTRYYTTAIWVGYDMPKKMEELSKAKYPGRIWQKYMNTIHENLALMEFPTYAQLSEDFDKPKVEEHEEVAPDPEEVPQPEIEEPDEPELVEPPVDEDPVEPDAYDNNN